MECPKCRHEIYLKLTPEELIYCPYCEQRMIPESAAALACEGGEPLPQEKQAEDRQESPSAGSNIENTAPLAEEETSASENLSTLPVEEAPLPVSEETFDGEQPAALPAEPLMEEVPPQNIEEERTVILEEIPAQSVPEAVPLQPCEELLMTDNQPTQDISKVEDIASMAFNEETPIGEETPAPQTTFNQERIPPYTAETPIEQQSVSDQEDNPPCAGEMPLSEHEQTEDTPIPSLENTQQTEDKEPQSVCQEPTETGSNSPTGNNVASDDFSFCFACGQKLLPDALFCSRCGEKTSLAPLPEAPAEPQPPVHISRHEDMAQPLNEDLCVTPEVEQPHAAAYARRDPSQALKESVPVPKHYVQPEDSPFRSREPVSIAINSRVPARKKASGTGETPSLAASAIRNFFSRQEVYITLGAIALVAFFALIGIAMSYCG